MARITVNRALIPAAVGIIDIGAKQLDVAVPPVMGWTLSEIVEAGLTIGSGLLNYMGKDLERTELIFNSSLPLFENLLVKKIMAFMPAQAIRAPQQTIAPRISGANTPMYQPPGSKYRITG